MGSCCTNNQKNAGIPIDLNSYIEPAYGQNGTLTENDIKTILKQIFTLQYNEKLYEKRELQALRAKTVREGFNERYIKLVEETQELERKLFKIIEGKVLQDFNVSPKAYHDTKETLNKREIIIAAMAYVLQAIRDNRRRLGLRNSAYTKLLNIYQETYNKCSLILNSKPDLSLKLAYLYDEELLHES